MPKQKLNMLFDPNNHINKLCIQGMELEGSGNAEAASKLFMKAWSEASTYPEKFVAAHYLARHQKTIEDKLKLDELALELALKIEDQKIETSFPSLYLNIGKGYEDLNDFDKAFKNFQLALSFTAQLLNDGKRKQVSRLLQTRADLPFPFGPSISLTLQQVITRVY